MMKRYILLITVLFLVGFSPSFSQATEPAPSVIVLSNGEPLLAGSVEAFVERQFSKRGFDVIDESGIPGVRAWLAGNITLEEEQRVLNSLARLASAVIVVDATYLGERPLYYLYRSEPIFQARLKVRLLPLGTDAPPRVLFDRGIEFTHLSLDRVIEKSLGSEMPQIVAAVSGAPVEHH